MALHQAQKITANDIIDFRVLCSVEEGILVRMTDKINRIATLIYQDNAVKDEKIQDTLLDLAVYSIILKTYLNQDVL